jgi:hypothetical protein
MIRSNPKHQKLFNNPHLSLPSKNRSINPKFQNDGPTVMLLGFLFFGGIGPLVPIDGKIN